MKKIILILSLIFAVGCSNDGGGVTSDPTPPGPVVPNPPAPTPVFNTVLSELVVLDSSNQVIYDNGQVGQSYKVVLTARDQFGNLMPGLDIKLGLRDVPGLVDVTALELSPGKYSIGFNTDYQGFFSSYVKYAGTDIPLLDYRFSVTFCNSPVDPSAAPFHSQVTYQSKSYYLICSVSDLIALGSTPNLNKTVLLGKTLRMGTFYSDVNSDGIPDNQFKIGSEANPFVGEFNGSGFEIEAFKYISTTENNVGLFAVVGDGASIKNLYFNDAVLRGVNSVGSIVGKVVNNGTSPAVIDNISIVNNSILGSSKLGGIAGEIQSNSGVTLISNVVSFINQNFSSISTPVTQVGGIVGLNSGGNLTNINAQQSFTGNASLVTKVGGLIGEDISQNNSSITMSRFYVIQTYTGGDAIGCVIGDAKGSNVSNIGAGSLCNIDQTGSTSVSVLSSGGLFGKVSTVSEIHDIEATVNAQGVSGTFGGVTGSISDSSVYRLFISGSIYATSGNLGGVAGSSYNSTISGIHSYMAITSSGAQNSIGGIVGSAENTVLSKVALHEPIDASATAVVGGIAGFVTGTFSLSDSYNNAQVKGDTMVGGLVGWTDGNDTKTISSSYSSGPIIGNSTVGGLVGFLDGNAVTVSESFSISSIKNSSNGTPFVSGSLIGEKGSGATISNLYFLSEASSLSAACGAGVCTSVTDTNTSADLVNDTMYYTTSSSPVFSTWNLSTLWLIAGVYLPYF